VQTERIEVRHGKLRLKSLVLQLLENVRPEEITVTLEGQAVPAELTAAGSAVCLTLDKPVVVQAGGVLDVAIRTAAK